LNVSASEKSTGKSNKITITNDKGRLSKEEIERMVEEAEKYKNEDAELRERIESKNKMEEQIYQAKNASSKLEDPLKTKALNKIKEYEEWHNNNQYATKDEYDSKMKEMSEFVSSFVSQPPSTDFEKPVNPEQEDGPKIEEID